MDLEARVDANVDREMDSKPEPYIAPVSAFASRCNKKVSTCIFLFFTTGAVDTV